MINRQYVMIGIFLSMCSFKSNIGLSQSSITFYRESDYSVFNRVVKIYMDNELKLGLRKISYDTIVVVDTVKIRVNKSKQLKIINNKDHYFQVVYKPSIFFFVGKFSLVEIEEDFFKKNVDVKEFCKGLRRRKIPEN